MQVLQAANTGITSLQKLVDSAKSIANQALQTTVGYVKSSATGVVSGATAGNLLGTTAQVTSSVNGSVLLNNASQTYTAVTAPPGDPINNNHLGAYVAPVRTGSVIPGAANGGTLLSALTTPPTIGDTLTVGANTYTITATTSSATEIALTDDINSVLAKLGSAAGGSAALVGGAIRSPVTPAPPSSSAERERLLPIWVSPPAPLPAPTCPRRMLRSPPQRCLPAPPPRRPTRLRRQ